MNINIEANIRPNPSHQHPTDIDYQIFPEYSQRQKPRGFSQPKQRINLIKINKNKLPLDFFQKRSSTDKLIPSLKSIVAKDIREPPKLYKKAQSDRVHYSPEKTSFFGYFDEKQPMSAGRVNGNTKVHSRKFETRQQTKRDAFPIQNNRKLTTAAKAYNNQFIDIFPLTHDQQISDIVLLSPPKNTKIRNTKLSPRKQYCNKAREIKQVIDPQESEIEPIIKLSNSIENEYKQQQNLNITFFNAKSSCFPPINRRK